MSDYLGDDMRKVKNSGDKDEEKEKKLVPLDEADIQLLRSYGSGPYARRIKAAEEKIQTTMKNIKELIGVQVGESRLFFFV